MQIAVDLVLVALGIAALISGLRQGALYAAASLAGIAAGFALGSVAAPLVVEWLAGFGWSEGLERTLAAALVVVAACGVCYAVAHGVVSVISRYLRRGPVRLFDQLVGGAVGIVAWGAAIWLAAGFVQSAGVPSIAQVAERSHVVETLDDVAPVPSSTALGALDDVLGHAGLPKVFEDGTEQIRAAQAPDPSIPADIAATRSGTVKVLASEPRCGTDSEGSGFVVAPERVVTNAHVVAGSSTTAVQVGGEGQAYPARLVVYDPESDLAVLAVPGLPAAPLTLGGELAAGDPAVVAGFPQNGPYDVQSARVRQVLTARGTDIYHSRTVEREIYSLRGVVRSGNSGGPLLDDTGRVVGVVFARSSVDPDTGYALTARQIAPVLAEAGASTAVSSGACTVG